MTMSNRHTRGEEKYKEKKERAREILTNLKRKPNNPLMQKWW